MIVCSAYLMHLNFTANTKRKCLLPFHFAFNPRRKVASSIIAMKGNPAMFWHTMLLITWLRSNPSSPSQIPQCALVTVTATRGSSRLLCGAPAPDRAPVQASDWFLGPATLVRGRPATRAQSGPDIPSARTLHLWLCYPVLIISTKIFQSSITQCQPSQQSRLTLASIILTFSPPLDCHLPHCHQPHHSQHPQCLRQVSRCQCLTQVLCPPSTFLPSRVFLPAWPRWVRPSYSSSGLVITSFTLASTLAMVRDTLAQVTVTRGCITLREGPPDQRRGSSASFVTESSPSLTML